MSALAMKEYLDAMGILSCNANPYLPSLGDIGCEWADALELMEARQIFTCKAYRKRTVYLSEEVYDLLKTCRRQAPLTEGTALLYGLVAENPGLERSQLRDRIPLAQKDFDRAFDFLFEQMYITALGTGTWLNDTWSTYRFGTATHWEGEKIFPEWEEAPARKRLESILNATVSEKEIQLLLK